MIKLFIILMDNQNLEFYLPTDIFELIFIKINSNYGTLHLKFVSKNWYTEGVKAPPEKRNKFLFFGNVNMHAPCASHFVRQCLHCAS